MEALLVAAWLVVAALLLAPPLLGAHRSEWPLRSEWMPESRSADADPGGRTSTPAGECRACGEGSQTAYTYCRSCLTPLPQIGEEPVAGSHEGHPAD